MAEMWEMWGDVGRSGEAGPQLEVARLVVGRLVRLVLEQPLACTESA